jgi:hypothetical protein
LEYNTPRLIAFFLLAALLLCALARGQETPALNPAGVYTLVSMDGKTVPCTIAHEGNAMRIQSGSFTITTNGQCFSRMVISVRDHTNIVCDTQATYTLKGAELTMIWRGAGRTKGAVTGNTFTMTNEGLAYVYQK